MNKQISLFEKINNWAIKNPKIFWPIGLLLIFLMIRFISSGGISSKPSKCDCKTVMSYGEGSVEAAKRILNYNAGENFMAASQRECTLKYWDEIKKFTESSSLRSGTPADNAIEYFTFECK